MRRTGVIIAAWVLLLVPTLLIGGMALRLLQHERERLAGTAVAAVGERVRAVAESIDLAVAEVKDGLLVTLQSLPRQHLADQLEAWRLENPLVRNVFIWSPEQGLTLPDSRQPLNDEEAEFLRRYDSLFGGRRSWQVPSGDPGPGSAGEPAAVLFSARRQLRELTQSKLQSQSVAPVADAEGAAPPGSGGWIPWFWENRFYLLGWTPSPDSAQRYGIEMETMALFSRLTGVLPAEPPAGEVYALLDGNGDIFLQSGTDMVAAHTPRILSLPVGPALPHWQVAAYAPRGLPGQSEGKSFLLLASLVVAAFVAAILFGGSLLLWQAWRNLTDARRKTSFVANVSHELKTPLTTIRMYAELLAEGRILEEAKRGRYLNVIVEESQRLSRLVNNVLDFGRLEQGQKTYALAEFDPAEILTGLLTSQTMRLEQAGMTLLRRLPAGGGLVRIDRDAFEQAVLNLIDNALKYAENSPTLEVELAWEEQRCRVLVLDRGPGVPVGQCQRIFEKFHRIDDSLTSRKPGSGLGLTIARQLLRDMGGELSCRERSGGGCCFEILLPRERKTTR
ncbi:MAG: HAMP domain-containing sensor histidine kinase [Desulfuromonadaceae bacterium]